MSSTNFNSLESTKLGDYGENLVKQRLRQLGYRICTWDANLAHPLDIIAWHPTKGLNFVEIKTKPRFKKWACTGLDEADWYQYALLQSQIGRIPLTVLWVDHSTKSIYGNRYINLGGYVPGMPRTLKASANRPVDIRLIPLSRMVHFADLTEDEVAELKLLSHSNFRG